MQRLALRLAQRRQQLVLQLCRLARDSTLEALASRRQVDRPRTAVVRVLTPLGEPACLQLIDHRDHRARVDRRLLVQLLLRQTRARSDDRQHAEVTSVEAGRLEYLAEAPARGLAEAREQIARKHAQLMRYRRAHPHAIILTRLANWLCGQIIARARIGTCVACSP